MSKKSQSKPLTFKDYAWIVGGTVAVLGLIPLIASFGAVMQIGFVLVMPTILIVATLRAFLGEAEAMVTRIKGVAIPSDVKLHPRHAWARASSSKVVVTGVDDFAQRLLGKVESVEAKPVGTPVKAGEIVAVLRSGGREVPVPAPIDGTVSYVNPALERDASIVNRECYGHGWLVELTPKANAKASLAELLFGDRAMAWMRGEIDCLVAMTSPPELGHTAADGGQVAEDLSAHLDEETWRRVKSAFFA